MTTKPPPPLPDTDPQLVRSLESIKQALSGLRFGTVAITVHEGRMVQIDVTEKRRLDR
ncbi:MAG: YezD family protein [Sphingobium sp.]